MKEWFLALSKIEKRFEDKNAATYVQPSPPGAGACRCHALRLKFSPPPAEEHCFKTPFNTLKNLLHMKFY